MAELELPIGYGQIAYQAACDWWHAAGTKEDYPAWSDLPAPTREYYDAMAQGVADYLARIP
jgi:hypothetical protein